MYLLLQAALYSGLLPTGTPVATVPTSCGNFAETKDLAIFIPD
jgi:hypothetical protein